MDITIYLGSYKLGRYLLVLQNPLHRKRFQNRYPLPTYPKVVTANLTRILISSFIIRQVWLPTYRYIHYRIVF